MTTPSIHLSRRTVLGGLGAAAASGAGLAADAGPADDILLAKVATFDPSDRIVEALAIRDGMVVAAGTREEVLALRGSATRVRDLDGAWIIPGFNDTHAHLAREGLKQLRPSLVGLRTLPELLARIHELAAAAEPGAWIVTMPLGTPPFYDEGPRLLAEGRMPTRGELDEAAPRNPVYLSAPFGFWGEPPSYGALNSEALRRNGITRDTTPRSQGIEIVRDAAGEPTGVLVNRTRGPAVELELLPAVPLRFRGAGGGPAPVAPALPRAGHHQRLRGSWRSAGNDRRVPPPLGAG